jgi:hypothetical protein
MERMRGYTFMPAMTLEGRPVRGAILITVTLGS